MAWRWWHPRKREEVPEGPDPLRTLAVQIRLGELSKELRQIEEQDPYTFARAHHYLAAQGAYDALLREACRMTGLAVDDVPLKADQRTSAEERFRKELELSSRGWSW